MSGFTSLNQLVGWFENQGGDPALANQSGTSTASGLYQITNPTWSLYGGQAGIDLSAYPTAASAPAGVQNTVFAQMVGANGLNDYTCAGCDPALTSYLAANPSAANLPVLGATGASGAAGGTAATGAAGASNGCGSAWTPTGFFCQLGSFAGNVAARVSLFILALILIAGGIAIYAVRTAENG